MKITRLTPRKSQSLGVIAKSLLSVALAAGAWTNAFAQDESATGIISGSIQDADYGGLHHHRNENCSHSSGWT